MVSSALLNPIHGKPLLIGEGIETVLTVMEATGLPGWATLGTSGLVNLELPDNVTEVILLAENDGGPNEKALSEIASVLAARGVKALDRAAASGSQRTSTISSTAKAGICPRLAASW